METFLNILTIISALAWIVLCCVAFSAIRLWKKQMRNAPMESLRRSMRETARNKFNPKNPHNLG